MALDGYYYLFRASSTTFKTYVYRSADPTMFADGSHDNLITELRLKAPDRVFDTETASRQNASMT